MSRTKQLISGAGVLCLLILVGAWFLIAQPRRQAVADLRAQADRQDSANVASRTQLAVLKDVASRLPEAKQRAMALSERVPVQPELVALIRQLTDAAKHSGVELQGIVPTRPAALPVAPGLSGISLSLSVKGDFASLEEYESQLEDLKRSFLVTGLTLAGGSAGSSSSAATDSRLTETISGQVLVGSPNVPVSGTSSRPTT